MPQTFLPTIKEGDEESASVCDGRNSMILQVEMEIPEPIEGDMSAEYKPSSRRWNRQRWKSGGKLEEKRNARGLDRITILLLGQNNLQENEERGRRGREVRVSTYHLRFLAGQRGGLHRNVFIHRSDSVNPDVLPTAATNDEELYDFDTGQVFLEARRIRRYRGQWGCRTRSTNSCRRKGADSKNTATAER